MNGPTITTTNPATKETIRAYNTHDDASIDALLDHAVTATRTWADISLDHRGARLRALAEILRQERTTCAELITTEMGKPIREAQGEIDKCALTAEYYAEHAQKLLAQHTVDVAPARAWTAYEPLGVILAVMPWNFPFWQVIRAAVPAVAAGNGILLKHAANVTGCALMLGGLFERAGFPPGLVTPLLIDEPRVPTVTESIIFDDRVQAVTLTGSNRAGEAVGAAAGRALKRSVLELGGSDPFVVLADADVEAAADAAVRARFTNSGQSCVCAKRFIVEAPVAEEFTRAFVDRMAALTMGDPADPATEVGPLARDDLRDALRDQVRRSVTAGATVLVGGEPVDRVGYFHQPTVLADARPGIAAFDEETFGPVAAIARVADADEAVRMANATRYGLGASVWTDDAERGIVIGRGIRSGAVFVNEVVASDPRVPFGGIKHSGYGRELGAEGIRAFTNLRTYWTK